MWALILGREDYVISGPVVYGVEVVVRSSGVRLLCWCPTSRGVLVVGALRVAWVRCAVRCVVRCVVCCVLAGVVVLCVV